MNDWFIKINNDVSVFSRVSRSSRPGRPPKRNSAHPIDDCLDDKRIKLSSSLLLRSFPDFANPSTKQKHRTEHEIILFFLFLSLPLAFKYPVHSNGYLSLPTTNGNQSSSFSHAFGYSAFAPTLPLHFAPNHPAHHHPYLLADTRSTRFNESNAKGSKVSTPPLHRPLSSSKKIFLPLSLSVCVDDQWWRPIHIQLEPNQLTYSSFKLLALEKRDTDFSPPKKDQLGSLLEWNKKQTTFSLSTQSTCYACQNLFGPLFLSLSRSVFSPFILTDRK